jgi:branched-chain amino acid aminotransferase
MATPIQITKTQKSTLSELDFNNIPFGKIFTDHMFVADYDGLAWINPRIVPFEPFSLHPSTMALHYGQAIFEGMKASKNKDGQPIFLRPEQHSIRLNRSAQRLCMPEVPLELFLDGLHTLVAIDADWIPPTKGSALYLRPFMFATDGFLGVRPSTTYKFVIFAGPVGPYYSHPISLWVEQKYVRAVKGGTGEAKAAGNYAGALLPTKLANENGYDQVMWMDGHEFKYVEEVGTMNIFFVIGDTVITPLLDGSILRGITRDSVVQLLQQNNFKVEERKISIDEILAAYEKGELKEVFGCGTAAVVSHVIKIGFQNKILNLPEMEKRTIGPWVKEMVDGLRYGTVEDKNGWVVPVKPLS